MKHQAERDLWGRIQYRQPGIALRDGLLQGVGWTALASFFFFSSADSTGVTFLGTTLPFFCFAFVTGVSVLNIMKPICLREVRSRGRYFCGVSELQRFIRSIAVIEVVIFVCWRIDFSPSSSI